MTLYRGVPLGKVPLKDAKDILSYNKNFGGWFTTDKGQAQYYARKNLPTDLKFRRGSAGKQFVGKLYSVKVSPLELRKIKQTSVLYHAPSRKFRSLHERHKFSQKLDDKTFWGTVPKKIRKKATLLKGVK